MQNPCFPNCHYLSPLWTSGEEIVCLSDQRSNLCGLLGQLLLWVKWICCSTLHIRDLSARCDPCVVTEEGRNLKCIHYVKLFTRQTTKILDKRFNVMNTWSIYIMLFLSRENFSTAVPWSFPIDCQKFSEDGLHLTISYDHQKF